MNLFESLNPAVLNPQREALLPYLRKAVERAPKPGDQKSIAYHARNAALLYHVGGEGAMTLGASLEWLVENGEDAPEKGAPTIPHALRLQAMSLGLAWLGGDLPDLARAKLKAAVERAGYVYASGFKEQRYFWALEANGNHHAWALSSLAMAAVATESEGWTAIARAHRSYALVAGNWSHDHGPLWLSEGPAYASFTFAQIALACLAAPDELPPTRWPWERLGDALLALTAPDGRCPLYGDGKGVWYGGAHALCAIAQTPECEWLRQSDQIQESERERNLFVEWLFLNDPPSPATPRANFSWWDGRFGIFAARVGGWSPNATWFSCKSSIPAGLGSRADPTRTSDHEHPDAGSFALYVDGEHVVVPGPGYSGETLAAHHTGLLVGDHGGRMDGVHPFKLEAALELGYMPTLFAVVASGTALVVCDLATTFPASAGVLAARRVFVLGPDLMPTIVDYVDLKAPQELHTSFWSPQRLEAESQSVDMGPVRLWANTAVWRPLSNQSKFPLPIRGVRVTGAPAVSHHNVYVFERAGA